MVGQHLRRQRIGGLLQSKHDGLEHRGRIGSYGSANRGHLWLDTVTTATAAVGFKYGRQLTPARAKLLFLLSVYSTSRGQSFRQKHPVFLNVSVPLLQKIR